MNLEQSLTGKAWKKIGIKPHHGIQVPLLSLYSAKSSGNGEFFDLFLLIDWLAEIGMDVLQLLPLNDSGYDASPYNTLSATALHPIYLSLHALPYNNDDLSSFKSYNETKHVPYRQILAKKMCFLHRYVSQVKDKIISDPGYQAFLKQSIHLQDYALYKVLREKHNDSPWSKWPKAQQVLSANERRALEKKHPEEITFYYILQYLCHSQLKRVKDYAEKKGIFLKGDLPILVSPDSSDVWAHQQFFDLTKMAGSPPSAFDPNGQLWKFPLYNWKAMEENHFEWWRKRVETAGHYYHIYRIDHILGFFRIWGIPKGGTPHDGQFIPDDPALMEIQGKYLLETLISFSEMLPIGEDLGEVPPFVWKTMEELGIPGIKIFRRQRRWNSDLSFIPYKDYTPTSVTSVSTHDLEPVRLWWEKFPEEAEAYASFKGWDFEPTLSPEKQRAILYDNHHSGSLFHINLLQEYLSLVPQLTWSDPNDEQINYPGTETSRNWVYRYKTPLEVLVQNSQLLQSIKELLVIS